MSECIVLSISLKQKKQIKSSDLKFRFCAWKLENWYHADYFFPDTIIYY